MERVAEPELMDDPRQAAAYAAADFAAPHDAIVAAFAARFPEARPHTVLDLGCGPADVSCRFAAAHPGCRVVGVDGARAMLEEGRRLVAARGMARRVALVAGYLPDVPLRAAAFDTVISNSLLHHLRDPAALWAAVRTHGAPGARVLVADLRRPPTPAAADALAATYAAGDPPVLRADFLHSLRAAWEPGEVQSQLDATGLACLHVEPLGDRHLLVSGRLP